MNHCLLSASSKWHPRELERSIRFMNLMRIIKATEITKVTESRKMIEIGWPKEITNSKQMEAIWEE